MEKHYNLVFLSDPGHGWLSVPRSLVNELGLAQQISSCSYQKGEQVYLEEDCDYPLFIIAAEKAGIKIEIAESHHDDDYVRRMEGYKPLETEKLGGVCIRLDKGSWKLILDTLRYVTGEEMPDLPLYDIEVDLAENRRKLIGIASYIKIKVEGG